MRKLILLFLGIFGLGLSAELNASCSSVNGEEDNGKCDKSDIYDKKCIEGSPKDCYRPAVGY